MSDQLKTSAANTDFDDALRALLSHSASEPDWARTVQELLNLAMDANGSFEFDRAIDYLETLEQIWDSKGLPEFSLDLRFALHREKGRALGALGRHEEAIDEYQKILSFCRDSSHLAVKSETFTQIGQLLAKKGDHDRALGYLQRAIGTYRRQDDRLGLCKALRNLGVVYVELGEFEDAQTAYTEAISIATGIADKIVYADLINNLGTIMNMKGNWRRALRLYDESAEIYDRHSEIRKSGYTKNNIAITLAEQGMTEEAFEKFEQAYITACEINDLSLKLIVDINLSDLNLLKGNMDKAKTHCEQALNYLLESNLTNGNLVETLKIAGKIAFHEDKYVVAEKSFTEALETSRDIGTQFLEAEVLLERGILYRTTERHFQALTDLEASYHIYKGLNAEGKRERTEKIINSIEGLYLQVFEAMAVEVDRKDPYTKGHSDRVASLALLLARELGIHSSALKTIVAAALLHDVGKIKIDDSVLKKKGKLTSDEFRVIQKHPELGVELLRGKEFPWDIKPLILGHHEKLNGKGYPLGLKGEDIPLGARIICVADVFDALTSDRVYRPAFNIKKAMAIMTEESGTAFDPMILKCFIRMVENGKADLVINSRTREDEMYSIWSHCMHEQENREEKEAAEVTG